MQRPTEESRPKDPGIGMIAIRKRMKREVAFNMGRLDVPAGFFKRKSLG